MDDNKEGLNIFGKMIHKENINIEKLNLIYDFDPLFKRFGPLGEGSPESKSTSRLLKSLNLETSGLQSPALLNKSKSLKRSFNDRSLDGVSVIFNNAYDISTPKRLAYEEFDLFSFVEKSLNNNMSLGSGAEFDGLFEFFKSKKCTKIHDRKDNYSNIDDRSLFPGNFVSQNFSSLSIHSHPSSPHRDMTNNQAQYTAQSKENLRLKNVIIFYEEATKRMEEYIKVLDNEYENRCDKLKNTCSKHAEQTQNLDRAYKYTYGRYEELKDAFVRQTQTEEKLMKANATLRHAVELAGSKISELLTELNSTKTNYDDEIGKLQTSTRLNVVKINGLDKMVSDLTRQNEELTKICDDFLNQNKA